MINKFLAFQKRFDSINAEKSVVKAFKYYYDKLLAGETGLLDKSMVSAPDENMIIPAEDLPAGENAPLDKLAVIKLNGGLGTSMGLSKAKSLLTVKDGNTFLDIIAKQILFYRQDQKKNIPLLFMNSFNTSDDTIEFLKKYEELKLEKLPLDFIQNRFPKIDGGTLMPFEDPEEKLTWNPPGHGEIYMALKNSGVLDTLIAKGYRYIFISNSDNLGAVVDPQILQFMAENNVPFIMEVCYRTEMDKKGGHLAVDNSGKLILRESAQCPENEVDEFQNINKFKYFNTNNLWVDLNILNKKLEDNDNFLELTPIMNHKSVHGKKVIQLESAMGAAINIFEGALAVAVDRKRFVPVKKTNEFLAVLSDSYVLTKSWQIELAEGKHHAPQVHLDERFYKDINAFEKNISDGIPSLIECESLDIEGNIAFGKNVNFIGKICLKSDKKVKIENREFREGTYII